MNEYSANEVRWLLSLSHCAAVEADQPPSFLSQPDGGGDAEGRLPTIARWADVHRARGIVIRRRREERQQVEVDQALAAVKLAERGLSEREIGEQLSIAQPTVNRRVRSFLEEILEVLGTSPA